jgi:hypothetical protein
VGAGPCLGGLPEALHVTGGQPGRAVRPGDGQHLHGGVLLASTVGNPTGGGLVGVGGAVEGFSDRRGYFISRRALW